MSCDARAEWLLGLAALVFPADPGRAADAFAAYDPHLEDLPDAAFTPLSLRHVAESPRRMAIPSFDEVRKPLAAWWWKQKITADQRLGRTEYPKLPGPPSGERPPPTETERAAVAQMVRAFKASTGYARSQVDRPEDDRPPAAYLAGESLAAARRAIGIIPRQSALPEAAE